MIYIPNTSLTPHHITSHHITSPHHTTRHQTQHHITQHQSHHITLHHITQHNIAQHETHRHRLGRRLQESEQSPHSINHLPSLSTSTLRCSSFSIPAAASSSSSQKDIPICSSPITSSTFVMLSFPAFHIASQRA
jgi:hypothetical protein